MVSGDLQIWLNHFEHHAEHPRHVPREVQDHLTEAERRMIAGSIATFQLGEQSEGATLQRAAEHFARERQLPGLPRLMELFIREEQRHAQLLREFMADHRIALKTGHWTDWVFRRARRLAGFELYLHVLICAELIGKIYYRALETATGCQRLKVLCRILVCEELAHVGLESQLLLAMQASRPSPVRALMRLAHRCLMIGSALVVWATHRGVLRSAGYNLRSFSRSCLVQYSFYLEPTSAARVQASIR